jgi:hypothetical protein
MAAQAACPDLACWEDWFEDALPPHEEERLERHLESCPVCQDRIHGAQGCPETLRAVGRRFGDPTLLPRDAALVRAVRRLHDARSPLTAAALDSDDLYFLDRTERPDLLGLLGRYEVQQVIGQGGMGIVLKAFDPALHRLVAIKVMAPALAGSVTARRRFTREARAAAAVRHEHVVTIHGVHEADGLPYLVMQYIAGESLQARLDRNGPLPISEAVRIGKEVAAGLGAAHAQGLIHRDIKPANILLEDGLARVKITDFGLARLVDNVPLTQSGVVAGTPEYMAPEQARGEPVDHRADLFALGGVLYAMCSGRPPFCGPTTAAVLSAVSEGEPPPIRTLNAHVPACLEAVIARLLARDAAERFPDAAAVTAVLESCLAHLSHPATVPAPELPAQARGRASGSQGGRMQRVARSRFTPGTALLAVLMALGSGALLLLAGTEPGLPARVTQFHQDFRALDPNDDALRQIGEGGRPDDRGLRITLPARVGVLPHSGYRSGFGVQGDFEATLAFEVLKAETPDKGYGVGVSIYAALDPTTNDSVSLAWRVMPDGQINFISDRMLTVNGRLTHQVKTMPSVRAEGRLRLKRVGSRLHYLVADGPDAPFVELTDVEFGPGDVRPLQVTGNAGNAEAGLDFRLLSLTVTAEQGLPGLPEPAPIPAPAPRGHGLVVAGTLVALLLLASSTAVVWIRLLRGRRSARPADASTAPPPESVFACSGCGKKLKVEASLAGRRVACPQCARVTLVPSPGPGVGTG